MEDLYWIWWGAIHHSFISTIPTHPKNAPQEPEETVPKASAPVDKEAKLVPEVSSTTDPQAIPTHMAPLYLQLGASRGYRNAKLRVAVRGQSTSCVTMCAHVCRDHLGVRVACPSCAKTFLNSDDLRHHKKIHSL